MLAHSNHCTGKVQDVLTHKPLNCNTGIITQNTASSAPPPLRGRAPDTHLPWQSSTGACQPTWALFWQRWSPWTGHWKGRTRPSCGGCRRAGRTGGSLRACWWWGTTCNLGLPSWRRPCTGKEHKSVVGVGEKRKVPLRFGRPFCDWFSQLFKIV